MLQFAVQWYQKYIRNSTIFLICNGTTTEIQAAWNLQKKVNTSRRWVKLHRSGKQRRDAAASIQENICQYNSYSCRRWHSPNNRHINN